MTSIQVKRPSFSAENEGLLFLKLSECEASLELGTKARDRS